MLSHSPIPNSSFGVRADPGPGAIIEKVARLINDADQLRSAFYSHGGLMVIPSLHGIPDHPELLVSISELFGPEVENVRGTLTTSNFFHPAVDEIMVLSNQPPCSHPPPRRVPSELSG